MIGKIIMITLVITMLAFNVIAVPKILKVTEIETEELIIGDRIRGNGPSYIKLLGSDTTICTHEEGVECDTTTARPVGFIGVTDDGNPANNQLLIGLKFNGVGFMTMNQTGLFYNHKEVMLD